MPGNSTDTIRPVGNGVSWVTAPDDRPRFEGATRRLIIPSLRDGFVSRHVQAINCLATIIRSLWDKATAEGRHLFRPILLFLRSLQLARHSFSDGWPFRGYLPSSRGERLSNWRRLFSSVETVLRLGEGNVECRDGRVWLFEMKKGIFQIPKGVRVAHISGRRAL